MQARQRVGLTRWVGPLPLRSKLTVQAGFVHRVVSLPPDRPNVSSKHSSIMRNCSGSLGSGRQDCCASAVWAKAEAAMRTAPTVAILRPPEQSIPDGVEP